MGLFYALFLRALLFTGFVAAAAGCSGGDGRVELSSRTQIEGAAIPAGVHKGAFLDKQRFETAIEKSVQNVTKVYNLSMRELDFWERFALFTASVPRLPVHFNVSFTIETEAGNVFEDVNCLAEGAKMSIVLKGCESNEVVFRNRIPIGIGSMLLR